MKFKYKSHIPLILSLFFTLIACKNTTENKPLVIVSIEPQRYFAEQIAGDMATVKTLIPAGANPETFEPTISNLKSLEKANVYIKIGNLPFETTILEKISANNPNLPVRDASQGISLLRGTHHHHHDRDDNDKDNDEIDPHTWSSVKNAKIIAKNTLNALMLVSPKNSSTFQKNYEKLIQELDGLDEELKGMLEPMKGTAFLVWHPSLSYYANEYGLKQIALGSEGKELSLLHMKEIIEECEEHDAKIFFSQKEFDGSQAETICEQTKTKLVTINPMDYDWFGQTRAIASAIASAKND